MSNRRAAKVTIHAPSTSTGADGGSAPVSVWLQTLILFILEVLVFTWSRAVTIHNENYGWRYAPPIPTHNMYGPYQIRVDNRTLSSQPVYSPPDVDQWLKRIDPGLYLFYSTDYIAPFWLPDSALSVLGVCLFVPLIVARMTGIMSSTRMILERLTTIMCCHTSLIALRTLAMWSTIGRAAPVCYSLVAQLSADAVTAGLSAQSITVVKPAWMFNHGCYDMIFSGHAATGILIATFIYRDQVLSALVSKGGCEKLSVWAFRSFCWFWAVLNAMGQVITGEHWSVDVVVGVAVAIGIWLFWCSRMAWSYHLTSSASADETVQVPKTNGKSH